MKHVLRPIWANYDQSIQPESVSPWSVQLTVAAPSAHCQVDVALDDALALQIDDGGIMPMPNGQVGAATSPNGVSS
jgi:hypothetical protein